MAKLNLPDIGTLGNSSSARQAINDNFAEVEAALDNTLSRDGTGPNAMEADLDMNSNKVLNVAEPENDNDAVNLAFMQEAIAGAILGEVNVTIEVENNADVGAAVAVLIEDAAAHYTSGNVEEALAEAAVRLDDIEADLVALAPLTPTYITLGSSSVLPNERILTVGSGLMLTDGGAGQPITIDVNEEALLDYADPVAPAFLKTVSDVVNGERVSVLRAIAKSKHSAIRAGTHTGDLGPEINSLLTDMAALGYGDLYVPEGTYTAKGLLLGSGLRLEGQGKRTIIKAVADLGNTEKLASAVGTLNDLTIQSIAFDGNNSGAGATQTRLTELLAFDGITNLQLTDVVVRNTHYIGAAFARCGYVNLTRVTAHECGWDYGTGTASANGGPALWFGPVDGLLCEDVQLLGCILRDNRWHGATLTANRVTVLGGYMLRNREAHIFSSRATGYDTSTLKIIGATAVGVTKADISSSGFEIGAHNVLFANNSVEDCDHNGLALTDVRHAKVVNNFFYDFGKDLPANAAGVAILSSSASGSQPSSIDVMHNRIVDRQASVTGYAAVAVANAGGAAVESVRIEGNDCTGWTQRGPAMVNIASAVHGSGTYARNNPGAGDEGRSATVYLNTTAQSIPNNTETAISFNTATINVNAVWSAGSPTRFTIPKGWKRVRIHAQAAFAGHTAGIRRLRIFRNGTPAGYQGGTDIATPGTAAWDCHLSASTAVIDVNTTDYFEVMVTQDSGGALNVQAGITNTWFSIEEVP